MNLNYNVGNRIDSDKLSLNYRVELIDDKSFILTVEFSRIDGQVGGMTLVSVGLPTGYSVDKESPDYSVIGSQMEEEGDQKVTYYYEEVRKHFYINRLLHKVLHVGQTQLTLSNIFYVLV